MRPTRRRLIAGNWKMNGLRGPGTALAAELAARLRAAGGLEAEVLICPPAQLLLPVGEAIAGSGMALGGIPGVIIGGQIGPWLQGRIAQRTMEKAIAYLFLVIGIAMGWIVIKNVIFG